MPPFRFSQFFISPLFTADATDREINAVDSGILYLYLYNIVILCGQVNCLVNVLMFRLDALVIPRVEGLLVFFPCKKKIREPEGEAAITAVCIYCCTVIVVPFCVCEIFAG
jgi:hypothetical protein